jgi:1-acyl-sn-glycerol-3-phosphate acyltransferase
VAAASFGLPVVGLAKAEHRESWLGRLLDVTFAYPGLRTTSVIAFFDRTDPASLPSVLTQIGRALTAGSQSVLIHVEGTRSLSCRRPVANLSAAPVDLAIATQTPIVPVRFTGALPVADLPERLEFPLGYARQDFWMGRPIEPEELRGLYLKERKQYVLDAMNALGPPHADETPNPPDAAFAAAVADWTQRTGASAEHAALLLALRASTDTHEDVVRLLDAMESGRLAVDARATDRWLGDLARPLFGARGPALVSASSARLARYS